jgi:hypothetical protein
MRRVNAPVLAGQTRRHFLQGCGLGLGSIALADMIAADEPRNLADPLAVRQPPLPAKAKRVIFIHLAGAPPHLDLFDFKPELLKRTDQNCPDELLKGKTFAFTSGVPKLLGSPQKFARHGQSGAWVSAALPELAKVADDLTFIKSVHSDQFNHAPAELLFLTGSPRQGRPSFGSWVTYGLARSRKTSPASSC